MTHPPKAGTVFSLFPRSRTRKLRDIRIIACDLDGTLLGSDSRLSDLSVERAATLRSRGIDVLLASGRSDGFTRRFATALGSELPVISLNGLLVCDARGGVLYQSLLGPRVGQWIDDERASDPATSCAAFLGSGIVSDRLPLHLPRYLRACPSEHRAVDSLAAAREEAVMYVLQGTYNAMQRLSVGLAKEFGARLDRIMYQSRQTTDLYYLEIKTRSSSKGRALRALARMQSWPVSGIAAIGDYANDIEMCRFAGVSAAMRNAIEELKGLADFVLLRTNDEDGVVEFFDLILAARRQP